MFNTNLILRVKKVKPRPKHKNIKVCLQANILVRHIYYFRVMYIYIYLSMKIKFQLIKLYFELKIKFHYLK